MKIITGLLSVVLQNEVKRLTEDNEVLKKTLGLEKEKLHALEAAVEDLHKKGECSLPLCISGDVSFYWSIPLSSFSNPLFPLRFFISLYPFLFFLPLSLSVSLLFPHLSFADDPIIMVIQYEILIYDI